MTLALTLAVKCLFRNPFTAIAYLDNNVDINMDLCALTLTLAFKVFVCQLLLVKIQL